MRVYRKHPYCSDEPSRTAASLALSCELPMFGACVAQDSIDSCPHSTLRAPSGVDDVITAVMSVNFCRAYSATS
jgi:hypothetical protein